VLVALSPPPPLDALVVLGCRVYDQGQLSAAAERRVQRAATLYAARAAPKIIASGGKRWQGTAEASAFAARLSQLGVPEAALLLELESMNTRGNARHACELARAHGLRELALVTCEWHMARALKAFLHFGFRCRAFPALTPRGQDRLRRSTEALHLLADCCCLRFSPRRNASAHGAP
jgi:uncharacterized SAM-binding protein YcdF (DUF218 family)